MELRVNDYVRTEDGIAKYIGDKVTEEDTYYFVDRFFDDHFDGWENIICKDEIIKSSPNIIDLLKKKDIVIDYKGNIYQVVKVWKDYVFTDKKNEYGQVITLVDYQIKSIVTKEQFESMEYKVGEVNE